MAFGNLVPDTLEQRIYDHYEAQPQERRRHLGPSDIGHPCSRKLWYRFRWAFETPIEGRVLRLFQTGNREEPRIVENLAAIGITVSRDKHALKGSTLAGHFAGTADGLVVDGLEGCPLGLECKTHSASSFAKLKSQGVRASKPEHYAQMQMYMFFLRLEKFLYFAVNKNTDEIYTELVARDAGEQILLLAKAKAVIEAGEIPNRVSDNPSSAACKYCEFAGVCHGLSTQEPNVNCRTCKFSSANTTKGTGAWRCSLKKLRSIPKELEKVGCAQHEQLIQIGGLHGTD